MGGVEKLRNDCGGAKFPLPPPLRFDARLRIPRIRNFALFAIPRGEDSRQRGFSEEMLFEMVYKSTREAQEAREIRVGRGKKGNSFNVYSDTGAFFFFIFFFFTVA